MHGLIVDWRVSENLRERLARNRHKLVGQTYCLFEPILLDQTFDLGMYLVVRHGSMLAHGDLTPAP